MPALTEMFGLKPWEIPHLTWDEVEVYRAAMRQRLDEQEKAQQRMGRSG